MESSGRVLDPYMPRYLLQDQDMAVMIAYLKTLSSDYSPGVDAQNFALCDGYQQTCRPESATSRQLPGKTYFTDE